MRRLWNKVDTVEIFLVNERSVCLVSIDQNSFPNQRIPLIIIWSSWPAKVLCRYTQTHPYVIKCSDENTLLKLLGLFTNKKITIEPRMQSTSGRSTYINFIFNTLSGVHDRLRVAFARQTNGEIYKQSNDKKRRFIRSFRKELTEIWTVIRMLSAFRLSHTWSVMPQSHLWVFGLRIAAYIWQAVLTFIRALHLISRNDFLL